MSWWTWISLKSFESFWNVSNYLNDKTTRGTQRHQSNIDRYIAFVSKVMTYLSGWTRRTSVPFFTLHSRVKKIQLMTQSIPDKKQFFRVK